MFRLLIIDDESAILHAFRRAFRPPEFEIATAVTARDGLSEWDKFRPDVVILDVHLPDGDGLQTYEKIRQLDGRVPVILITGHGTSELAIEGIKRFQDRFL